MKYPIKVKSFPTFSEAIAERDKLNNLNAGKDIVAVVRRGKCCFNVFEDLIDKSKHAAKPHHEESELQRTCVTWFRLKYKLMPDYCLQFQMVVNAIHGRQVL